MYVLFDKNKNFIGYSPDFPDTPNLGIFKLKLPEDQSDINEWTWEGDMFTGKMVKIKD
jgi:hypothetical protein